MKKLIEAGEQYVFSEVGTEGNYAYVIERKSDGLSLLLQGDDAAFMQEEYIFMLDMQVSAPREAYDIDTLCDLVFQGNVEWTLGRDAWFEQQAA